MQNIDNDKAFIDNDKAFIGDFASLKLDRNTN